MTTEPETTEVPTDEESADDVVNPEVEAADNEAAANVDLESVDPVAKAIAAILTPQLKRFEASRDLFVEDRDARKAGTQSVKAIMARMQPHQTKITDEESEEFRSITQTYLNCLTETFGDSLPGILSILWGEITKDGSLYNYVVDRSTDIVTSGPTDESAVVPTITELAAMRTTVVGLFDSVAAIVGNDRAILKALGVPTKYATKGRADGTKLILAAPELPKESKVKNTAVTVIFRDEEEIYVSGDGKFPTIPAAIRHHIGADNWKAFEAAFQTKGQTLTSFAVEFGGAFYRAEERKTETKAD